MSYSLGDFAYDFWCVLGRNQPEDTLCMYHHDLYMKMSEEQKRAHNDKQQEAFSAWRVRQNKLHTRLFIAACVCGLIYKIVNPSDGCIVEYDRGRAFCQE